MDGGDDDLGEGCGKIKRENDGENFAGNNVFDECVVSEGKKSS